MRISTPCRAIQCVHPQCFDALSWYSVNEQTTTWSCPICEKPVNHEDLIVDGYATCHYSKLNLTDFSSGSYFDHILKSTPEEVEDVMVEADGEWHTSDNMYASPAWKATHKPPPPALSLPPTPEKKPHLNGNGKSIDKEPEQEVFVLDDSDDEEGQVKRELSFSVRQDSSALSNDSGPPDSQVIDLTLDSDEDEPAPPPSLASSNGKRKALDDLPSPTEQIWKKSRVQDASHTVMRSVGNSGNVNGSLNGSTSGSNIGGSSSYMNDVGGYSQQPQHPPLPSFQYDCSPAPESRLPQASYTSSSAFARDYPPYTPSSLATNASNLASTLYKDRYHSRR